VPALVCALHAGSLTRVEFSEVHMGLPVRIVLYAADDVVGAEAARTAFARVAALDLMMSDYRAESDLHAIEGRAGDWVPVSPELYAVVERSIEIARASSGAFDPTVGPLVTLWRDARRSLEKPDAPSLDRARARVGWQHVALDARRRAIRLAHSGMRLDLGGIAKGYILQEAVRTLEVQGVTRALVEAGGDIVVGDAPPRREGWSIDVPAAANRAFRERAMSLRRAALATSGPTMQFVEIDGIRYSHVVDPRTGLGLTNHIVARVISADGATADALATALTVIGPADASALLAKYPDAVASLELSR
jgi:FAD:protein FMN transferase